MYHALKLLQVEFAKNPKFNKTFPKMYIAETDQPGNLKLTIKGVLKFQQIINERLLQLAENKNNAK
jgi:hypothetical protein